MTDLHWPPVDEETLALLPPIPRAMVRALGFGRACIFLQEYGGIPFILPMVNTVKPGLMADEIIRLRITLKPHLNAQNELSLPKADKLLTYARDQEILKHRDSESITTQALKYKLTSRQVQNIRGQHGRKEYNNDRASSYLTLRKPAIDAMKELAYKACAEDGAPIYREILNVLERASFRAQNHPAEENQFNLF